MKRLKKKSDARGFDADFWPPNLPDFIIQNCKTDYETGKVIITSKNQLNLNKRNRYADVGYVSDDLKFILEGYNYGRKIPTDENELKIREKLLNTQDVIFVKYNVDIVIKNNQLTCTFTGGFNYKCYYAELGQQIEASRYLQQASQDLNVNISKEYLTKNNILKDNKKD